MYSGLQGKALDNNVWCASVLVALINDWGKVVGKESRPKPGGWEQVGMVGGFGLFSATTAKVQGQLYGLAGCQLLGINNLAHHQLCLKKKTLKHRQYEHSTHRRCQGLVIFFFAAQFLRQNKKKSDKTNIIPCKNDQSFA